MPSEFSTDEMRNVLKKMKAGAFPDDQQKLILFSTCISLSERLDAVESAFQARTSEIDNKVAAAFDQLIKHILPKLVTGVLSETAKGAPSAGEVKVPFAAAAPEGAPNPGAPPAAEAEGEAAAEDEGEVVKAQFRVSRTVPNSQVPTPPSPNGSNTVKA